MSFYFGNQTDCINDKGVIVSIGIQVGDQSSACVFPMGSPTWSNTIYALCGSAALAVRDWFIAYFLDKLSTGAYLSYVQAEGMVDGLIPYRAEFAPSAHPGTVDSPPVPQQVAALITMYQDQVWGNQIRRAHQYIPGMPQSSFAAEILDTAVKDNFSTYFDQIVFTGISDSILSQTWYRYLGTPYDSITKKKTREPGTQLQKIAGLECRSYAATQKRRLLPRY